MFYKLTVKARKLALSLEPASKNQSTCGGNFFFIPCDFFPGSFVMLADRR